ncbi:tyrosine-type recombinase/integrase, partial [Streptomyces globisporus]|uniref:tyrosine-type recombinase/integrase n=1 Tax=Streptomyces globisporus TaxID=1908 RepID=UPI00373AED63
RTFDSFVVERFITAMERSNVGAATQAQVFLRVKGILKDAHRRGIIGLDPLLDVSPPEYRPGPTVIPTKEQVGLLRTARDDDAFRLIVDLMAGMGLRNGEALAVNVNNMVAKDVYRVHQQVHDRTVTLEPLKHRKAGEFREVPLPSFVRESIEHYAATHGTFQGGYLLKTMRPSTGNAFLSPTTLRRWWTNLQTSRTGWDTPTSTSPSAPTAISSPAPSPKPPNSSTTASTSTARPRRRTRPPESRASEGSARRHLTADGLMVMEEVLTTGGGGRIAWPRHRRRQSYPRMR